MKRHNLQPGQMSEIQRVLIIQTAFLGDVILTLPLAQGTRRCFPDAEVDMLVIPGVSGILLNHPALTRVIAFDKKGTDSGVTGLWRTGRALRSHRYDLVLVPHRSLRSAVLAAMTGAGIRIAFNRSAGAMFFTNLVRYDDTRHEIERNLSLLGPLHCGVPASERPQLFPSEKERRRIHELLDNPSRVQDTPLVGIAPGTVWKTKQWLPERYAQLAAHLVREGYSVVFVGGSDDAPLCDELVRSVNSVHAFSLAGQLSLLESAELLRRCRVVICNDSAPMHIAVGVQTRVVAIFGATVPEFGFAPYGTGHSVVQKSGLSCRPCSRHGGNRCPIGTFACMKGIEVEDVLKEVLQVLHE